MSQTNRRAAQRFEPKLGNRITYGVTSTALRDLSLGGIFVLDADPFPVGSEITFMLRAGNRDISLDGVVRHSLDQDGMGIQFTKVSPESSRRLRIHISSLVPAPSQLVIT